MLPSPRYFLKIAEIKGDARNPKHDKEVEILSWSWGETQNSTFGATSKSSGGNVAMRDFVFTSVTGAASPQFLLFCASGKSIKSAILTCERPDGKGDPYLTITLSDAMVVSYDVGAGSTDDMPNDQITLRFKKIEWKYLQLKSDGSSGGVFSCSWDLAAGAK